MPNPSLAAARELRSFIDANAATNTSTALAKESVDAMYAAGLYGIMCPRDVGGGELGLCDTIDVFAEVARADASTGWCLMASASAAAYFGAYCEQSFVDTMFADGIPRIAGQFAPNGTGVEDGDGYRITGNYQFGSGLNEAEWVGAGFLVHPAEGSSDPPRYLFSAVPKDQANLQGNWDVLGLKATGSYDYQLEAAFAPRGGAFLFAAPTRRRGGPLYELGVITMTAAGHAGFAIGVARRAIDELRFIAKTKIRMGSGSFLRENERFLQGLGRIESRLRSASAWVHEVFLDAERAVEATETVDPERSVVVRQATVHVTEEAADLVREAYLLAGTSALRDGPLQRCFRDIHAASQHFFASPASTLDFARNLMGSAPDSALDAD